MPCTDDRDRTEREEMGRRLDLATRLLCEVMGDTLLDPASGVVRFIANGPSAELIEWWAEHQKADAERKAASETWERADADWAIGFIAWIHTSGAVVWKFDQPESDSWCYGSDPVSPRHGDGDTKKAYQPDIEEAKRLALILVAAR